MSWRSPRSPKRTGRRSGRTTPSSGSTRRSSAEPMSWRSSPTPQRSCAWQPPWSSNPTTNGRSPAAISPMSPWTNYAPSSPQNTRPQHWTNNTKSPSVQQDSLITMRKPRQDPKSTNSRDAIAGAAAIAIAAAPIASAAPSEQQCLEQHCLAAEVSIISQRPGNVQIVTSPKDLPAMLPHTNDPNWRGLGYDGRWAYLGYDPRWRDFGYDARWNGFQTELLPRPGIR